MSNPSIRSNDERRSAKKVRVKRSETVSNGTNTATTQAEPIRPGARSERLKEVHRNINALNDAAFALRRSDPVGGLKMASEAQMLAKGNSYEHGMATSLCNQGFFHIVAGNYDRARHDLDEAFVSFDAARDKNDRSLAATLLGLGVVAIMTDRLQEAMESLERSLRRSKKSGDLEIQAEALCWQGEALIRAGELDKGKEYLEKGLAICDEQNDQTGRAACMLGLAVIRKRTGEMAKALLLLQRTAELAQREGARVLECRAMYEIAVLQFELGDNPTALDLYTRCIELAELLDARSIALESYRGVGAIYIQIDDAVKSIEYANHRLDAARSIGSRYHESAALNSLGNIYYRLSDFDRALSYYTETLEIAIDTGRSDVEEVCLENLGNVHRDVGEYTEALEFYARSRRLSARRGNKENTISCYFNLGLLAIDRNDYTTAIQHLSTASIGAEGIGARRLASDANRELAHAYELRGSSRDTQKALDHFRIYHRLSQEILRVQKDCEIANIRVRADIERQEKLEALYQLASVKQPDQAAAPDTIAPDIAAPDIAAPETVAPATTAPKKSIPEPLASKGDPVAKRHPELSPGELKICALMLTGLSTREMSTMLGVTDRAVEKHRYKIRRKLALPRSTNLNDYLGRLQGG